MLLCCVPYLLVNPGHLSMCLNADLSFLMNVTEASSVVHTGLQLFPGFLNADRRAALDSAALAYQKWGRQQMKLRGTSGPPIEFFSPAPLLPLLTKLEDAVTKPLESVSPSPDRPSVAALKELSQGDADTFILCADVDKHMLRMSLSRCEFWIFALRCMMTGAIVPKYDIDGLLGFR
jgi:hypothetical protein